MEQTVLDFLKLRYPQSSTTTLRRMLTQGRVEVNGTIVYQAKHPIQSEKDIVNVLEKKKAEQRSPPPLQKHNLPFEILFEDENLLVVDKPAGMLTIATDKLETNTLHSACVEYLKTTNSKAWAYIVHRLDRDTSGLLVFAKDAESKQILQEQFAQREVHRHYLALLQGHPTPAFGTLKHWIFEDQNLNVKLVNESHPNAKNAITHYHELAQNESTSLVSVTIETGRRHQIRLAMKYLNTPILGDEIHAAANENVQRLCLHAYALEFLHPLTDEPLRFETPLPLFALPLYPKKSRT